MCVNFQLHYIPIFTTIWFLATFIITYTLSVSLDHVHYVFPYISDTATLPPEANIFGLLVNLGTFLIFINVCLRYKVVQILDHRGFEQLYQNWNKSATVFGFISCLGMTTVASFPQFSVFTVHILGAFTTFLFGTIYCIIQSYLTRKSLMSVRLKALRVCFCVLMGASMLICGPTGIVAGRMFDGEDKLKWTGSESGYAMHLLSSFTEWILVLNFVLFIGTFYVECKAVEFHKMSFLLK